MRKKLLKVLKRLFTRRVRAGVYTIAAGLVVAAVSAGWLPEGTLAFLAPLLLALLNLKPDDVADES